MKAPRALTIAGSDSSGGAGVQADLKTFAALEVYGLSALTSLTSQNTLGVNGIVELDPEFVSLQIRALVSDIGVDAVKTGMLRTSAVISGVSKDIRALALEKVVVDPVMISSSGDRLLNEDAVESLIYELFPLSLVITPNLNEVKALTGITVHSAEDMRLAAWKLKQFGPGYVVIKGGHLRGSPMDLLYDGVNFREYHGDWISTPHTHGTGCTFASAIAAFLARGFSVEDAVGEAKDYTAGAIAAGFPLGRGSGPVHHFYKYYKFKGLL